MREPRADERLRHALLHASETESACDVDGVSRRIKRSAGSDLLRLRHRPRTNAEYISQWCTLLMPVSCVCAVFGIIALGRPSPLVQDEQSIELEPRASLINAATNRISTPELVDILLSPAE